MIRMRKSRLLIGFLIAGMLVTTAVVMLPQAAFAAPPADICTIDGFVVQILDFPFSNWSSSWVSYGCGTFPNSPASCTYYEGAVNGHDVYMTLSTTTCDADSCFGTQTYAVEGCGPASVVKEVSQEVAPSIFLSDVCQPNDGFGGDGYMTLDTNAGSLGVAPVLYYGASADGPWASLEVNGPPYNLTMSDLTAMAANSGAADYSALWVKVSETGRAMLLGDMIRDRAAKMDVLCGE